MPGPDGYQVGNAWVQVLPSFNNFHKRMAAELAKFGDVKIPAQMDLDTKRAEAAAVAAEGRISKTPVEVKAELNTRYLDAKIAKIVADKVDLLFNVDLDIAELREKIQQLERQRGSVVINVDAEIGKAEAKIESLENKRAVIEVKADVDTAKAERELNNLDNHLARIGNSRTDINMEAGDASRAVAILGALIAALGAVAYAAPAAAAAIAAIPNALLAAGQGIGTIKAGFAGIGDAVTALQAVDDEAATKSGANAAKRTAAADRIASAQSSLERALEGADRAAIQGAHQVSDAREGLASAEVDAARRVEDAEQSLQAAQLSARDAQVALNQARKEAAERLDDLRISVAGAALDEEGATYAVQRAQEKLTKARAAGVKGLDLAEISLSARQAQQSLNEVKDRYADLKAEAAQAGRAGVNGSTEVVAAQRVVQDSTRRVQAAERGLATARTDGARQVAKAQEQVARAQQAAGFAAADASRSIADAQRAIAQATQATGAQGSAAINKLQLAMAKLTPEGREFARFIQSEAKPALLQLGAAAQTTLLPKVEGAFRQLLELSPLVEAALQDTGNVLGDLALKGAEMVTSGPWRADFVTIADRNNRILALMGDTGLSLLDSFRSITVASGPLAEGIALSTQAWADQFNTWIQGKRDSGELERWFAEMGGRIRELWDLLKQFTTGIVDFAQALAPLGRVVLHIVGPLVQFIGALAEANPTITTVIALFVLLKSGFISFFRTLGGLAQASRTSKGVFSSMVLGQQNVAKATSEATAATGRNATAQKTWRDAVAGNTGLVGRTSTGLRTIRDGYIQGSTAAGAWATAVGSKAVTSVTNFQTAMFGASKKLADQGREFGKFSGGVASTFSHATAVAGGTAVAIGKGVTGAVGGLVGALGGPFGLAITGAVVGLGLLAQKQADAAEKTAQHEASVKTLTDALIASNGKVTDSIVQDIITDLRDTKHVADNVGHLGLKLGDMVSALSKGGEAASSFESNLHGVGRSIIDSAKGTPGFGRDLEDISSQLGRSGGEASDFSTQIHFMVNRYRSFTGATDEQTDAFENQLVEYLDLVGKYKESKDEWSDAQHAQEDNAAAHREAASAIEQQYIALKNLQGETLQTLSKSIAYRQAQNGVVEAHTRVQNVMKDATHTEQDLTDARLNEEQAIAQQIAAAGELAVWNTRGKTESEQQKAAYIAQANEAKNLANTYGVNLPEGIKKYLADLGVAKNRQGNWVVILHKTPKHVDTTAQFHDADARKKVKSYGKFLGEWISDLLNTNIGPATGSSKKQPSLGDLLGLTPPKGKALGGIMTPFAQGGMQPMAGGTAEIVAPNTFRLIGDRMTGDEAYIPLVKSARSIAILGEAAKRLGFSLVPMLRGGLLALADGAIGTATATPATAAASPGAALVLDPASVDLFTVAAQTLVNLGLAPLAAEVNGVTVPAMVSLEQHAGTLSVEAINRLITLLPTLQRTMGQTAQATVSAWARIVGASNTSVGQVRSYLGALRTGLSATVTSMTGMANASVTQFGRVRPAAADPIRWVLQNPVNAGLIGAWARLNTDFALKKPVRPVPVPFAFGGRVPGFGNGDTVDAKLTPGEYVLSKPAIANMGGVSNVDRMHRLARAGVAGPNANLGSTKGDALERLKLMRTIPLDGLGFAYGGVQPHVARAGDEVAQKFGPLPGGIGGVGQRPNESDHPLGLALDFMTLQNTALGDRIAQYLQTNSKRLLVKYLIWKQRINEGSAWTPMEDRGSITANHFDHVHSSFLRFGQTGKQFTGAGVGDPATYFAKAFSQINQVAKLFPGNKAGEVAAAVARQAVDGALQYANEKVDSAQTAGSPEVTAAVRAVANTFGWGSGTEWSDLSKLISGESGWNPKAANPTSSARGLFQKLTSMHGPIEPTVRGQAEWGLNYIKNTYGTPSNAYHQWLSRSPHWYDEGGMLPPGYSTVYNGTGRAEHVLNNPQWNSLISMAAGNGGGQFNGNLYLSSGEFLGAVRGEIDQANTTAGRSLASRIR